MPIKHGNRCNHRSLNYNPKTSVYIHILWNLRGWRHYMPPPALRFCCRSHITECVSHRVTLILLLYGKYSSPFLPCPFRSYAIKFSSQIFQVKFFKICQLCILSHLVHLINLITVLFCEVENGICFRVNYMHPAHITEKFHLWQKYN